MPVLPPEPRAQPPGASRSRRPAYQTGAPASTPAEPVAPRNADSPSDATGEAPSLSAATLAGTIERITYQNEETGYSVIRVLNEAGALITVVGDLLGVVPGEAIEVAGHWEYHREHGRQLKSHSYRPVLPATIEGIRKYLGSGLIKGVGPVSAQRIVDHFGAETLKVIDEQPARLGEVPGVGRKRQEQITRGWAEQRSIKDVMILLTGFGVNPSLAVKIYREYGDSSVDVVKNQPYRLARDVWGIGFKTADRIARGLGLPLDSPERAQAGLRYALSEAADDGGHCFLPRAELVAQAAELLSQPDELVESALAGLIASGDAVREQVGGDDAIYLVQFYRAEGAVARRLNRLRTAPIDRLAVFGTVDWEVAFAWLARQRSLELAPKQAEAARRALTEKVLVLTGGPGTGKSTTVRSIVQLAQAKKRTVVLAAPTGRAAKRLTELSGLPAKTIHRLIGLKIGGVAELGEDNPIDADLIVVDEASMLDIFLINSLLKAVPPDAHLLLVGDADQLPAVGAGNVLADLIASEVVPVVRLETVFRQAETSAIIANAHRINAGEHPRHGPPIDDFFFFPAQTPEAAADLIVDLASTRVARKFGIPPAEIQVLCPMHRGPAGVAAINERLQEALNPAQASLAEARVGAKLLRVGDRVIALRNDYELDVYNGDLGIISAIDAVERAFRVRLEDGREVDFDFAKADEVAHAWALSVHKAQGSEFRAVIVPMLTAHYPMLARNLLYTAVTRARELVVLVGQQKAIAIAVRNNRVSRRYSGLAQRLRPAGNSVNQQPNDPE